MLKIISRIILSIHPKEVDSTIAKKDFLNTLSAEKLFAQ